jgi:uncharacterized Zn ribbon protein
VEWAGATAPNCPSCRKIYEDRTPPEKPPCNTCRPELQEENDEPLKIYQEVRGQVIALGDQVIDINHLTVRAAMDRQKVKDPDLCFDLVCKVFHHFLQKSREERNI